MTMLLDDPSPLVRQALAEALAYSPEAPASVVYALAAEQPQISAIVLEHSPLLIDADLVDAVATQGSQAIVAPLCGRAWPSRTGSRSVPTAT